MNVSIFRHAEATSFSAGQTIFREGEKGTHMYVISEGQVEIIHGSTVLETVEAGSIFGEMALIDQSPRSATAKAKTDCKVVPIDQRRFEFLVQQTPFFSLEVMQIMAERLRNVNGLVAQ